MRAGASRERAAARVSEDRAVLVHVGRRPRRARAGGTGRPGARRDRSRGSKATTVASRRRPSVGEHRGRLLPRDDVRVRDDEAARGDPSRTLLDLGARLTLDPDDARPHAIGDARRERAVRRRPGVGRREAIEDLGERRVADEPAQGGHGVGRCGRDPLDAAHDRGSPNRARRPARRAGQRRREQPHDDQHADGAEHPAEHAVGGMERAGECEPPAQHGPADETERLADDGDDEEERERGEQARPRR